MKILPDLPFPQHFNVLWASMALHCLLKKKTQTLIRLFRSFVIEFQPASLTSFIAPFHAPQPNQITLSFWNSLYASSLNTFVYNFLSVRSLRPPLLPVRSRWHLWFCSNATFPQSLPFLLQGVMFSSYPTRMTFYFYFCSWCFSVYNCVLGSHTFKTEGS